MANGGRSTKAVGQVVQGLGLAMIAACVIALLWLVSWRYTSSGGGDVAMLGGAFHLMFKAAGLGFVVFLALPASLLVYVAGKRLKRGESGGRELGLLVAAFALVVGTGSMGVASASMLGRVAIVAVPCILFGSYVAGAIVAAIVSDRPGLPPAVRRLGSLAWSVPGVALGAVLVVVAGRSARSFGLRDSARDDGPLRSRTISTLLRQCRGTGQSPECNELRRRRSEAGPALAHELGRCPEHIVSGAAGRNDDDFCAGYRVEAAMALLGELNGPDAKRELGRWLSNERADPWLRAAAGLQLAKMGERDALPTIVALFDTLPPQSDRQRGPTESRLLEALGLLRPPDTVQRVKARLTGEGDRLVLARRALILLMDIDSPESWAAVDEVAAASDVMRRREALSAVRDTKRFDSREREIALRGLEDPDAENRGQACSLLQENGGLGANAKRTGLTCRALWASPGHGTPEQYRALRAAIDADRAGVVPAQLLSELGGDVRALALAKDLSLAVSRVPGGIEIWNVETQKRIATVPGSAVDGLSFSPDGKRLFLGDGHGAGRAAFFDTAKGELREMAVCGGEAERGAASLATASADGRRIAGGSARICIHDADSGKEVARATPCEPAGTEASTIALSRDGKRLAARCGNGVKVIDLTTGLLVDEKPFTNATAFGRIAFSPDGRQLHLSLATRDSEGVVRWDTSTRTLLTGLTDDSVDRARARPRGRLLPRPFAQVGNHILTGGLTIQLWDAVSGSQIRVGGPCGGLHPNVVALSPDERVIATGGSVLLAMGVGHPSVQESLAVYTCKSDPKYPLLFFRWPPPPGWESPAPAGSVRSGVSKNGR